jgi:superfamily II DNA or RNA helicase
VSEEKENKWVRKTKKADIMSFFPYAEPRDYQTQVLKAMEKYWDDYDV